MSCESEVKEGFERSTPSAAASSVYEKWSEIIRIVWIGNLRTAIAEPCARYGFKTDFKTLYNTDMMYTYQHCMTSVTEQNDASARVYPIWYIFVNIQYSSLEMF